MMKTTINFMLFFLFVLMVTTKVANCQCPDGYTLISGECFKAYNTEEKTWQEAEDFCEQDGGHLAYILNCTVLGQLAAYIRINQLTPSTSGYWIGASDSETEGTWLWTNRFEVPMGVPFWGAVNSLLEPQGGTAENCAQLKPRQYYIYDEACATLANPLCQIDLIGNKEENTLSEKLELSCPDGFELIHNSCFSFHVDTIIHSWSEAREFCQDRSADLSVIKDCTLLRELVQVISEKHDLEPNYAYFIGGTDIGDEGWWTWIDFSYVDFGAPFWAGNDPAGGTEENCAFLGKNEHYYFLDLACDQANSNTKRVFCQRQSIAS